MATTPSQSHLNLSAGLPDNNIGQIQPQNIRDIVETYAVSSVVEAFDPSPTGAGLLVSIGDFGKSTLGSLTVMTEPPAWMWPRPAVLASTASGARYISQVDGDFVVTGDNAGYTYAPADGSLPMKCELEVGIFGAASSNTMFGALVIYKTINDVFNSANTHRHCVIPFDTGATAGGPFYCSAAVPLVLSPNDSVRVRLEYYGTSSATEGGTAVTPLIGGIVIAQYTASLGTRGVLQPTADAAHTEPSPNDTTRWGVLSDISGKASGVPLANRSTLV